MSGHNFDDNGWCEGCKAYDCDIIGELEERIAKLETSVPSAEVVEAMRRVLKWILPGVTTADILLIESWLASLAQETRA